MDRERRAELFGMNLREARQRRRLSQATLARLSEMSLSHLARLEAGRREPRLSSIAELAQALEVDVADLMRGIR